MVVVKRKLRRLSTVGSTLSLTFEQAVRKGGLLFLLVIFRLLPNMLGLCFLEPPLRWYCTNLKDCESETHPMPISRYLPDLAPLPDSEIGSRIDLFVSTPCNRDQWN